MRIPADDEALVEMRAVRGEDVLAPERAADEGNACVHDEGPEQERAEHERVALLVGGEQGHDRETVSEEGTGNVAHKNFGGLPIVDEKSKAACGNRQRDPEHERVREVRDVCREQCPAQPSRERYAARHAVNAVHEIVGVGQPEDPQEGDDDSDRA